jgi:uncharacterized MnhB-related membrane protein
MHGVWSLAQSLTEAVTGACVEQVMYAIAPLQEEEQPLLTS